MFVVGERDSKRRHFEVDVGGCRRAAGGERGRDGSGKCFRSRQTFHVDAVDVEHVASYTAQIRTQRRSAP